MDTTAAPAARLGPAPSIWSRLVRSPFELGQHEFAAFAGSRNPHDLLIDRIGGPLAIQIGLLVGLIALTGANDPGELRVGLAVAGAAIGMGVILIVWGNVLSLDAISTAPVLAAGLVFGGGRWGGDLALATPVLCIVVTTAIFAQRPWRYSLTIAAVFGAAYAVVLATVDLGPAPVSRWVITMTAILSFGAFVQWIRRLVLEVVEADLAARQRAEGAARELAAVGHARSEFLARMSHHLRTPLNAVVGFTSILQSGRAGPLNERQTEYLEDVKGAGLHLTDLVDELFDLARIEAGSPRLQLEPVYVQGVVDECLRIVRERASRSGVVLSASIDPRLHWVVADVRRLRQVLLNLTANAVRFTPYGGSVVVRAWAAAERVCFSVSDTGIGIPADDQARMFDRFEQVADPGGGTGIGLSLARRFVEQHGGEIAVASRPGEGAEFRFWLPEGPVPTAPSPGSDPASPVEAIQEAEADEPASPEAELFSALIVPGSDANRTLIATVGRWVSLQAAALALVLAAITPGPGSMRLGIGAFSLAALTVMAALRGFTERAPLIGIDLIFLFGLAGISGIALAVGSFADLAVLAFGWLIMTAFAPWARWSGWLQVGCVGIAYAVVLAVDAGPGSEVARWITVVGLLGINGLTVRSLVQKLRVMVFAERDARVKAEAVEEELQRAAMHKDDFVGSVSHELRTPLHAVIGFADVLLAGAAGTLTDEQRSHVAEIRHAGQQLLDLINDILALARLDTDPPRVTIEPVVLDHLVARVASSGDLVGKVAIDLPLTGDISVDADATLVEHALTKLLRRAVDASPQPGTVRVELCAHRGAANVRVHDAGPGLPAAVARRLAVPLEQVDDLAGPLLGLSLAHRVAEVHDGALSYDRRDGTSTFTLRLPADVRG